MVIDVLDRTDCWNHIYDLADGQSGVTPRAAQKHWLLIFDNPDLQHIPAEPDPKIEVPPDKPRAGRFAEDK